MAFTGVAAGIFLHLFRFVSMQPLESENGDKINGTSLLHDRNGKKERKNRSKWKKKKTEKEYYCIVAAAPLPPSVVAVVVRRRRQWFLPNIKEHSTTDLRICI